MYPCFVHSFVSMQKLIRIATEKRQNSLSRLHDCVYSPMRANAAPILPRFFAHPIFRTKLKTLYLENFVNFVNHFGDSHFHWTRWSRTIFIFCRCSATFKFIDSIVNSCKHFSRCAMHFIQLSFDHFRC